MRYTDENKSHYFLHVKPEKYGKITEYVTHNPAYDEVILNRIPKKTSFLSSHSLQTDRTPRLRMTKTIWGFTKTGLTTRTNKNNVITTYNKKHYRHYKNKYLKKCNTGLFPETDYFPTFLTSLKYDNMLFTLLDTTAATNGQCVTCCSLPP